MATKNVIKHYTTDCDLPRCMCVDQPVRVFFKDGVITTDAKPYIDGTVTALTQRSDSGWDLTFTYSDTTAPTGFTMVFPTASAPGNVCDPDCFGECDWLWKVQQMIDAAPLGVPLMDRAYQIYLPDQWVENGVFDLPRIPFDEGFRVSEIKLTCGRYDPNTTTTIVLTIDGTTYASFSGSLNHARGMNIAHTDMLHDKQPVLTITGTTSAVYADAALGLVIEIVGMLIPV